MFDFITSVTTCVCYSDVVPESFPPRSAVTAPDEDVIGMQPDLRYCVAYMVLILIQGPASSVPQPPFCPTTPPF